MLVAIEHERQGQETGKEIHQTHRYIEIKKLTGGPFKEPPKFSLEDVKLQTQLYKSKKKKDEITMTKSNLIMS